MKSKLLLASGALAIAVVWVAFNRSLHPLNSVNAPTSGISQTQDTLSAPADVPKSTPSPMPSAAAVSRDGPEWKDAKSRVALLNEILISKNDNDPRLDTELRKLSPATKTLLKERYTAIAAEKRNERGTVVFLMGRELETAEDWSFLTQVVTDQPCLSLSDCTKADPVDAHGEEKHLEGADELTRAYPEVMSVASVQRFLENHPKLTPAQASYAREFLEKAQASPIERISSKAKEVAAKYAGSLAP